MPENNNYTLKLVLIFGLTKDGMQQHIVIVTRGINCISMELKQITIKYCLNLTLFAKQYIAAPSSK